MFFCPLITKTVNSSLSSGHVPSTLKLAAITPILKKPGLDPDSPNNYRPISNLPFLSKVLKKVVATQIKSHLDTNHLYEPFQSGFRSKRSTKTAVLKVTNDLLLSSDSGFISILILFDLSAAFDTVNRTILITCLKSTLGITGTALSWFHFYLSDRHQFISINNSKSDGNPRFRHPWSPPGFGAWSPSLHSTTWTDPSPPWTPVSLLSPPRPSPLNLTPPSPPACWTLKHGCKKTS